MAGKWRPLAFAALVLLAVSSVVPDQACAQSHEKVKIRFGIGSAVGYNAMYVAKEKAFFDEEGLDVEFVWAQAAPEVVQGIIGGSFEGGAAGSFGLIAGVAKGAPVTVVAIGVYGGDKIAFAARKDSGIKTFKDLYGKKVGFQSGTIGQQMFLLMGEAEKLDVSKIDGVFLNNVDMAAAIASKSVDAIVTWEPLPSLLVAKGAVDVIQRGGKYLQAPGVIVFGNDYIKKNHNTVLKFVTGVFRGAQFIRQNPKEAAVINGKYTKGAAGTPDVIQLTYKYVLFDPRVTKDALRELESDAKFLLSQKKIDTLVKASELATTRFSDEIAKKHPELVKDLK